MYINEENRIFYPATNATSNGERLTVPTLIEKFSTVPRIPYLRAYASGIINDTAE